jgi:hypothetical protein
MHGGQIEAGDLARWTPFHLHLEASRQIVAWLRMDGKRFREPFFADSVAAFRRRHPEAAPLLTEIEALEHPALLEGSLPLAGFIFHMSRCGSTALSRSLAASPGLHVIAEAEPVNQIMGADPALFPPARRAAWLQALLRVLARRRTGRQRSCVIKFSSWNALHLAAIRQAFPGVPWVFVHREPLEVLVSLLSDPPGWLRSPDGPWTRPLWPQGPPAGMPPEELCATLLAAICRRAAGEADGGALFVDGRRLSRETLARVLAHFRIAPAPSELDRIVAESSLYSKGAGGRRVYLDDSAAKRERAAPALRAAAERWLGPAYQEMARAAAQPASPR